MRTHFCLTVRFLQPYSHGRDGDGDPEWPPSPFRVFQALVAAAAARWNERIRLEYAVPALCWLERQSPPTIVAAPGVRSDVKYRLYVPDNVTDKVARAWSGGREASIADYRTEKDVRPTRLLGDAVHYLFPVAESDAEFVTHRNTLIDAARSITHLGWGIDMVVGNAAVLSEEDIDNLPGERWRPAEGTSADCRRVPIEGTLQDLMAKHTAFLNRLSADRFRPVPPLSAFRVVGYRRPTDTPPRPFVAFELRTLDFERFQPFDPTRHACAVARMVCGALADLAGLMRPFGWTDANINTFIRGRTPDGERPVSGPDTSRRLAYLPLPSLERRGGAGLVVTAIRRVLVVGPPGGDPEVRWARVLSGRELTPPDSQTPPAALRLFDRPIASLRTDPNLGPYVGEARVWSTVTPLVLPGYDEADPWTVGRRVRLAADEAARRRVREQAAARTESLLRRAFEQAGISPELVRAASLEWRQVGFRAGVDLASRYLRPEPCRLPRYHVRVRWPVPIWGPLAVGAARYRGLGIFAAEGPT
jgi:CRISPR-associated protein Csb2